jgi:hypothetical protein
MKRMLRVMYIIACALLLAALVSCVRPTPTPPETPETPETPEPPAHEHNFGEWTTVNEASCSMQGLRERRARAVSGRARRSL